MTNRLHSVKATIHLEYQTGDKIGQRTITRIVKNPHMTGRHTDLCHPPVMYQWKGTIKVGNNPALTVYSTTDYPSGQPPTEWSDKWAGFLRKTNHVSK